ncbi:MAG: hypothetical protein AMXMBFR58_15620 [Phycisphaerae bacterium]|nr:hypothetical protein [Phycisphaerales bacterium]MCK6477015.1 outer membrane protein assembly factor BamE [Phycisphaerales bacterium]
MLRTASVAVAACVVLAAGGLCGCASKPAAEVSKGQMAEIRQVHGQLQPGAPRQQVLDSFKAGNKVKLGTSSVGGIDVEEWKVEAYYDEKERKNLFVTFLYFVNGKLADSSDARIDFRSNPELVDRWGGATK